MSAPLVIGEAAFGEATYGGTSAEYVSTNQTDRYGTAVYGASALGEAVFGDCSVESIIAFGVSSGSAASHVAGSAAADGAGRSTGSANGTVNPVPGSAHGIGVSVGSAAMRAYLLAGWRNSDNNLLMMQSTDGANFTWVDGVSTSIPSPASESVLDPSIIYYHGRYYLAHDIFNGPNFSILTSSDLVHWDFLCHVTGPSTTYLWAPEWFVDDDGSVHIYFSAGNTIEGDFQIYEVHPVAVGGVIDFTVWSTATHITGTGTCLIDPCVVKKGGVYYLWYKDERIGHKTIEYGSLSSPTGSFTSIKTGNWAGWGTEREGPMLFPLPDGSGWRIYFDLYDPIHGLQYSDSVDDWATWSAQQPIVAPSVVFHGDVRPFTQLDYAPGSSGGGGTAAAGTGEGISLGSAAGTSVVGASAHGQGISLGSAHATAFGSASGRGISLGRASATVFGTASGYGISLGSARATGTITGYGISSGSAAGHISTAPTYVANLTLAMRPAVTVTCSISPANTIDLAVRPAVSVLLYVLNGGTDVTTTVLVNATEDIVQGCDALIVAEFKNDLSAYVDPTTVTFAVKPNGQTEVDYVYDIAPEVTKAFPGRYVLTYDVSHGVTHDFYVTGDTPAKAAGAGYFTVKAKPF